MVITNMLSAFEARTQALARKAEAANAATAANQQAMQKASSEAPRGVDESGGGGSSTNEQHEPKVATEQPASKASPTPSA